MELSSDAESNLPPPSRKCATTAAHASKNHRKDKHNSNHALPPPIITSKLPRHQRVHADESNEDSDYSLGYVNPRQAQKPSKARLIAGAKSHLAELSSDLDSPPRPKRKSRTASRIKNCGGNNSASDAELKAQDVPSTLYGGLQDEDDTAEKTAAITSPVRPRAAAKQSKVSVYSL